MGRRAAKTAALAIALGAVVWALVALSAPSDRVLAEGEFHQVAHKGSGRAAIVRQDDGRALVRLTGVATAFRPDLEVLLISAPDAAENETVKQSESLSLGSFEPGRTDYRVPGDIEVERFHAVTIWSRKYQVNFTTAPLAWREGR